jgi:hypothetical protein
VAAAGLLAVSLHRAGHTQGDDFALYLRQARSLFDGDVGAVVADNRFSVISSDRGFSPIAYPWGWPLLLAPFVSLWGYDYDQLKLVVVAAFCVWLVLVHGIVRRRLGRVVATAFVAVFATAPLYLAHTDQLLSEFPQLAAVALVIWWYDRVRGRATTLTATTRDLVVLGLLVTVAFELRRESVVLILVIAVVQLLDLWRDRGDGSAVRGVLDAAGRHWRRLVTPAATFAAAALLFQLLLPTELLPGLGTSNSNATGDVSTASARGGRTFVEDRLGELPGILTDQLGIGVHPAIGVALLAVAAVGVVVGVRRRPELDLPLAALGVFTALVLSDHGRKVDRYWYQVTPWVAYFVVVAVVVAAHAVLRRRRRLATLVAITPLLFLVAVHVAVLPGDGADARDHDAAGRVQFGPAHPSVVAVTDAVEELTPPDAVIAYFRARTMTLLTDRRAFQSKDLERIAANADYFVQRRDSTYWQPPLDRAEAAELGFDLVWSGDRFLIWATGR